MKRADRIPAKIYLLEKLKEMMAVWRLTSHSVAFTNGVFDLLHAGHLETLAQAASLADILIVAINSDASVRRLKGNERPINDQDARAHIMASLVMVDAVIIFDEDTPLNLIRELKPDVLVKGGDYQEDDVVGARDVKEAGGTVAIIPVKEGFSTTGIITKIRRQE